MREDMLGLSRTCARRPPSRVAGPAPARDFAGRRRTYGHLLANDPIFGLTLHINNPLKHNVISCRFRARLAILYNVAARQFAL